MGRLCRSSFWSASLSRPESVALRYKDLGLYQEVTWRVYRADVEAFALGLIALGVEPGDRIAIMGDPCYEYFVADMAGCASVRSPTAFTRRAPPAEVRHQLENAGAKIFIAENQEYVDKVLDLRDLSTELRHIVVADMRAMFLYRDERIVSLAHVQERGRELGKERPACWRIGSARSSPTMWPCSCTRRARRVRPKRP